MLAVAAALREGCGRYVLDDPVWVAETAVEGGY